MKGGRIEVINLQIPKLDEALDRLTSIEAQFGDFKSTLDAIQTNQEKIMATLDQITQDMADETTAIDGLSTFIAGLKQQLADALAGATLNPATQAKVDAIFAAAEANKAKLAAALAANVPPAPPA